MPKGKNYPGPPEGYTTYSAPENSKQVKTASKGSPGPKPNAGAGPPEKGR